MGDVENDGDNYKIYVNWGDEEDATKKNGDLKEVPNGVLRFL